MPRPDARPTAAGGPRRTARPAPALDPSASDPLGETRRLVAVRRTAYLGIVVASAIAVAAFLVVVEGTTRSAVDRVLAIGMLVGFAYALVELLRPDGRLRRVEIAVFLVAVGALVGGLVAKLFGVADHAVHVEAWRDFGAWGPLAYFWAYFAFGRRYGLLLSVAFYALALAVLGVHALLDDATQWRSLATFYLASWVYVPGLYALAWLFERHARALTLAETAADRAFLDPLTGLPNRTRFMDRLERALALAERQKSAVTVFFLDLDGFKAVNDAYGHAAGDALLRTLAARFGAAVRKSDTVARLAGDEFTVLAGEPLEPDGAMVLAQKLTAACSAPVEVDGRPLRVTASVGVAFYPDHGGDAEALVRAADAAMYAAKWGGGGRIQLAKAVAPRR